MDVAKGTGGPASLTAPSPGAGPLQSLSNATLFNGLVPWTGACGSLVSLGTAGTDPRGDVCGFCLSRCRLLGGSAPESHPRWPGEGWPHLSCLWASELLFPRPEDGSRATQVTCAGHSESLVGRAGPSGWLLSGFRAEPGWAGHGARVMGL